MNSKLFLLVNWGFSRESPGFPVVPSSLSRADLPWYRQEPCTSLMSFQEHFLAIKELNTTLVSSAVTTALKFNLTNPTSF